VILEPFGDDAIVIPLKADGPALPGAQEWRAITLKGTEGVARSGSRHPLADNNGSWPGPLEEHRRVRLLGAMVG
jgi:hypothetical protein